MLCDKEKVYALFLYRTKVLTLQLKIVLINEKCNFTANSRKVRRKSKQYSFRSLKVNYRVGWTFILKCAGKAFWSHIKIYNTCVCKSRNHCCHLSCFLLLCCCSHRHIIAPVNLKDCLKTFFNSLAELSAGETGSTAISCSSLEGKGGQWYFAEGEAAPRCTEQGVLQKALQAVAVQIHEETAGLCHHT